MKETIDELLRVCSIGMYFFSFFIMWAGSFEKATLAVTWAIYLHLWSNKK